MAFYKAFGGKATWELCKDAAYCFEQIPEAATYKTVALQPLTSHFTNHPSKMNKTCWTLLLKHGLTHKQNSSVG